MITDYASLLAAIRERLTHAQLEGATALDVAVQMGQLRIKRALTHVGYSPKEDVSVDGAFTLGDSEISEPPNNNGIKAVYIKVGDEYRLATLQPRAMQGQFESTEGVPETYYAQAGKLIFAPVPDQAYAYRIEYAKDTQPLSATNPTNWYVQHAPDALFYSCLLEAADAMREMEKSAIYQSAYSNAISGVIDSIQAERFGSGPLVRKFAKR